MRRLSVTSTALALLLVSGGALAAVGQSQPPELLTPTDEPEIIDQTPATCFGREATIVAQPGLETIGTAEADVIVGTDGDDVIRGEGGNDRICAGDGADIVDGGDGKDRIDGGPGDDQLDGGASNDTISGGKGADTVLGGAGNDRLAGEGGGDTLDGGKGKDTCAGGPGHDWLPGCNDNRRTRGKLVIRKDTTLKGPHRGEIVIEPNNVTLDCGGHTVLGPGGGFGILMPDRRGVTVKNCEVTNFNLGISVTGGRRNTVTRNKVRDNSQTGIEVIAGSDNRITWNTADDNGLDRQDTYGINVKQPESRRNIVKHNSASGNGDFNIALRNDPSRNVLAHNTTRGANRGIHVSGARNTVTGNVATEAEEVGIESWASNSVFTDNTASRGHGIGIHMQGFENTVTTNVATDNAGLGFQDRSMPGANEYAENICFGNLGGGSSPEGLCAEPAPAEAEVSAEPVESGEPVATTAPTD